MQTKNKLFFLFYVSRMLQARCKFLQGLHQRRFSENFYRAITTWWQGDNIIHSLHCLVKNIYIADVSAKRKNFYSWIAQAIGKVFFFPSGKIVVNNSLRYWLFLIPLYTITINEPINSPPSITRTFVLHLLLELRS